MRTRLMFGIILLGLVLAVTKASANPPPEFCLRVSAGPVVNFFGDRFYFHTGSFQELVETGKLPNWNHTLSHFSGPTIECRWNRPVSKRFDLHLSARYQPLRFSLRDSLTYVFGWLHWYKSLDASIHFMSVGSGLTLKCAPFSPYVELDIGYGLVDLMTTHIFEVEDEGTYATVVDGGGGGMFFRGSLGATMPVRKNLQIFVEAGYILCANWGDISVEGAQEALDEEFEEVEYDWLTPQDRSISRHYLHFQLGVSVGL